MHGINKFKNALKKYTKEESYKANSSSKPPNVGLGLALGTQGPQLDWYDLRGNYGLVLGFGYRVWL
jgi:hypothetical protein